IACVRIAEGPSVNPAGVRVAYRQAKIRWRLGRALLQLRAAPLRRASAVASHHEILGADGSACGGIPGPRVHREGCPPRDLPAVARWRFSRGSRGRCLLQYRDAPLLSLQELLYGVGARPVPALAPGGRVAIIG